ncbi:DUF6980 family protein [Amaricoccus sp.]|uniref:DUF6980 family protein n=1 Tax=Amaricoccus sp. TaxID=1872485 RepID=UPI003FA55852
MTNFLNENKVAISYLPRFREYAIDLRTSGGKQLIDFCPWCGEHLPKSLRDQWFDEMESRLGDFDNLDDPRIPIEFRSDKWWRDKNL